MCAKVCFATALSLGVVSTVLAQGQDCNDLPSHDELQTALSAAQARDNGGFGLNMWGSIVNRDGVVCAVAMTGSDRGDQWPGSRVISAQKANTANAFSLPNLALSTANLWFATQSGQSLFGLQHSNPVDPSVAYGPNPQQYGTAQDPLVGKFVGGVNVFGGGLALYAQDGTLLGAVGVSGDSSCADHNIAWRLRDALELDNVPGGVAPDGTDNIIYDLAPDEHGTPAASSPSGFGHPKCGVGSDDAEDNAAVVEACPIGPNPTGADCT
ncbi:MAG TPA: heme-binding protein [Gammaproteobacteria bacterium]